MIIDIHKNLSDVILPKLKKIFGYFKYYTHSTDKLNRLSNF